ncbi:MAG: glycosyltransferase [Opitutaceae bacterium]|nr:glycosyltransferase [Opitutaceae bacterium]
MPQAQTDNPGFCGAKTFKVTVAIPTYNRGDFLRQTLAGIVAQQFPRDHFEVLVIDNNSTDHTRAVVGEFQDAQPAPRYIHEPQQGLDYARNRAIAEARGEILVFGDDDILVQPDWLAQIAVPLMADHERRIGAVGGEVIPVFPDGLPDWVREWHAPLGFRRDTGPLEPRHSPMGANLAFPKWVFSQLGAFHTALDRAAGNYFSGGDSEMIRRIRHAGLEVWFSAAAAVKHQMPASRTTFRYASRHAFDSARSRVIDRAGQPGAHSYLAGRFLANLAKVGGFSVVALLNAVIFRPGEAKKALVRAWRSCGYLYQIPRSFFGKV